MRRSLTLLMLVGFAAGCRNADRRVASADACAPADQCAPLPAPRIEVQSPETIVVKAPTPRIVMEQQHASGPASSQGYGGVPQQQPGFGGAPQQGMMPMGYYPMMPQGGFGGAPGFGGGMMGGEVKERTSVGFMFDTIKIPLPWLRFKAIQQPSEVTFRTQMMPNNGGFGAVPMMMGGGGFGSVPMGYGAMPMGFGGMPQGGFGGAPMGGQMTYTGTQYVPMQGTMPMQVPTGGGGAVAGGGGGGGTGPGFGAAGGTTDNAADAVEKLKQKLKECEDLQNKIKQLQAAPPPKTP